MMSLRTLAEADRNTTARVQDEVKADYNRNFARGGTVFFQRLPAFTLCFPSIDAQQYPPGFLEHVSANLTDRHAKDTLERDFKCLNWQSECTYLIPLYTTGDGNCLLHAASLAMWGIEDKQFILRNALYDSLTTATPDANTLQDRCRQSVVEMLRSVNVNLSDHDWEGEWRMIVNQATPNTSGFHQSLEESHIFVLANILRRPIIVYGVPKVRSFNTGGTMQNINFHGIYLPLLWGSQLCHKAPLCLGYSMGHFTALVPVSTPRKQSIVPILDNMGHELPIRFLLQAEQQNTFYLLQQYLDVTQQYSGTLRRQVSVAVLAIREAAHVPHLVSNYINTAFADFTKQNQSYYTPNQPGAATSQSEDVHRQSCIGCDSGVYASAETNFLCSVCYRKQRSTAANYSGGLKCRSPGCQEPGLTSKDGYCNNHYTRNPQGGNEQFSPNNFDQVGRPKCKQCNDFFANEELNGLCSGCFKTLSIKESNEKPPPPQQQFIPPVTPIQNANNVEPVADKCYKCKQFHGDRQWGGLCSMCFKEKSKQEANMKPPAQMRNDFQQPAPPNQQAWPNQQPPPQQPAYGQGRLNYQTPNPQQTSSPFGAPCMTDGCARFADEDCQGYCTQCFASRVERVHQQQQQQQQYPQYQHDQWRQQEEQERRRQLELEQSRIREEEARKQQEARRSAEAKQQEEQWRRQQEQQAYQQRQIQTADFNRTVEHQSQQQYQPPPNEYNPAPVIGLCRNQMCSHLASANCDGYCVGCFSSKNQTTVANPTQGEKAPTPNLNPTQGQKASAPSNPSSAQLTPPPIKPRKNAPKTAPKAIISEEPANQTSQIKEMSSMPGTTSTCFMCAKIKPTTVDFTYNLCHKHAAIIAASFGEESPQVTTKPSMQQEAVTNSSTQQPYNPMSGTKGVQQRRGSAFDDQQQQLQTNRYSAEQKTVHHSREQYPTGPPMTHRSGEQQSNRSPHYSGPQSAYNNSQGTGYPAAGQGDHQNQQPMGALSHFSGEQSNRYNDNPGSQSRGQVGLPMNTNAPYPSYTQSGNQFSSQSASHQPYSTGDQFNSHRPMQNEVPYHSSGDQLLSGVPQVHPRSKKGGYDSQEMQGNNNFITGTYGDARNPGDIKYPPTSTGGWGDQSQYNFPSSQHSSVPSNQYNGHSHHNQYGQNDPSQLSYQQQHHQPHYQHEQGQQQYQEHHQQSSYHQSQQHQAGGYQATSGRLSHVDRNYNTPQAGGYGESAGASGQQFPPHKPTMNTFADTDVIHSGGDVLRAKVLCKTPGCSFYAKANLENYCDDCYEKSGLKRYSRCQNQTCGKYVAGTVSMLCESCLLASKQ